MFICFLSLYISIMYRSLFLPQNKKTIIIIVNVTFCLTIETFFKDIKSELEGINWQIHLIFFSHTLPHRFN